MTTSPGNGEVPLAFRGLYPTTCISHVMDDVQGRSPHSRDLQGGAEGLHLQVLLLPGEGVGQPLHGLGSVLRHLGLDGVRDFLEHRVDLFQEATGLVNVIQLQKRPGRRNPRHLRSCDPWDLSSDGPRTVPPHRDGTSWEQHAGVGQDAPLHPWVPDKP